MIISLWVVLCVAIEFLIEVLKQIFPIINTKIKGVDNERVIAFIFGLLMCFGASIDFFRMLGITYNIPYVGYILSAIFLAGGSGKLHDFIKAINTITGKNEILSFSEMRALIGNSASSKPIDK